MLNKSMETCLYIYNAILDNVADALAIHKIKFGKAYDIAGFDFAETNRQFELLFNVNSNEIIGKTVNQLLSQSDKSRFCGLRIYQEIGLAHQNKEELLYCDDMKKWVSVKQLSFENEYIGLIFSDKTGLEMPDRGPSEMPMEKMKALTREYETIFNSAQDPMFLVDFDCEDKFTYRRLNSAYEKLIGLTTERVKGHSPREVFGAGLGKRLEERYRQCVDERTAVTYEEPIALSREERIWHTVLTPIIKDGRAVHIVGIRRDITKLKEMEKVLIENEEQYRSLFENNHAVMLLIEPETGRITDANPAACSYYGYSKQKLRKMRITDINILSAAQVFSEMQEAKIEKRNHFFFIHKLANGEIRDVEVYSGPIMISGKCLLYSIIHDITDRRRAESALINEKELFKVTMHSMGDGLATTDTKGRITLLNKAAEKITDWTNKEAVGKPFEEVFHMKNGNTGEKIGGLADRILRTGDGVELKENTVLVSRNGTEKNIEDSGAPIRDGNGNILGTVLVFRDVSEEKRRKREIEYLGLHDKLTGLYNRTFLEEKLKELDTEENLPISLIMGDANGLKLVNDAFGHDAGDRLLKGLADILRSGCRENDFAARIGGDEFVMILPKTGNEEAEKMIERILSKCRQVKEGPIKPSVSLGLAIKEHMGQSLDELYKTAEDRMYSVKLMESRSLRSSIIASLRKTLNERTHETVEHSERMTDLAYKMGKALKLSADKINNLKLLALLHDIGITSLPDHILARNGDLTQEEWRIMQTHCTTGYRIAGATPDLAYIAGDILSHHENWDGSGYPQGLSKEEIPLNARIIAILDTYDAMVNGSFYQKILPEPAAVEFIKKQAGIRFDPEMVEVFIKIVTDKTQGL